MSPTVMSSQSRKFVASSSRWARCKPPLGALMLFDMALETRDPFVTRLNGFLTWHGVLGGEANSCLHSLTSPHSVVSDLSRASR